VLVVEVDTVGGEPSQRPVDGDSHVRRGAVEVSGTPANVRDHAELGGQDNLIAPSLQGAPHQLFVRVRTVDLGGVDEGDTQLEGAVDRVDGLGLVDAGVDVGGGHAHRSQSYSGHLQAAELDLPHVFLPFVLQTPDDHGSPYDGLAGDARVPSGNDWRKRPHGRATL
jgi:hypothetical protein